MLNVSTNIKDILSLSLIIFFRQIQSIMDSNWNFNKVYILSEIFYNERVKTRIPPFYHTSECPKIPNLLEGTKNLHDRIIRLEVHI